jgi:phosphate transport system substrate-binding protein
VLGTAEAFVINRSICWAALLAATLAGSVQAQTARDYISIVGSSTVFPFSSSVAETFGKSQPQFKTPKVESTGTGGGIKLFCGGVGVQYPDIANASRRMKPAEFQDCVAKGVKEISEIKFGYDGIVLANAKSSPLYKLTRRDLYLALAKQVPSKTDPNVLENNPYTTWDQVNSSLPKVKIEVLGPPPTSGTRDAFVELVMENGCQSFAWLKSLKDVNERRFKQACDAIREDGAYIEAGENDNLIVQKLQANKNALGIFGYSFLEENRNILKGSQIEGVGPEFEDITSGRYPVSRSLYFYVKKAHVGVIPGIKEFVAEFMSPKALGEEGYLAAKGLIPLHKGEVAGARKDAAELKSVKL